MVRGLEASHCFTVTNGHRYSYQKEVLQIAYLSKGSKPDYAMSHGDYFASAIFRPQSFAIVHYL